LLSFSEESFVLQPATSKFEDIDIQKYNFAYYFFGCETWSFTLREERRLRVFKNRMLRGIFGPKRDEVTGEWRKLQNEVGPVARIRERKVVHRGLVGKTEGNRPLARPRNRWEDNKYYDESSGSGMWGTDWTELAQVAGTCECGNEPSGS
jgi:hypothetical protein